MSGVVSLHKVVHTYSKNGWYQFISKQEFTWKRKLSQAVGSLTWETPQKHPERPSISSLPFFSWCWQKQFAWGCAYTWLARAHKIQSAVRPFTRCMHSAMVLLYSHTPYFWIPTCSVDNHGRGECENSESRRGVAGVWPGSRKIANWHYSWLHVHSQNPITRREIEELVKAKDEATLKGLLESRMTFGTAGNFRVLQKVHVLGHCQTMWLKPASLRGCMVRYFGVLFLCNRDIYFFFQG